MKKENLQVAKNSANTEEKEIMGKMIDLKTINLSINDAMKKQNSPCSIQARVGFIADGKPKDTKRWCVRQITKGILQMITDNNRIIDEVSLGGGVELLGSEDVITIKFPNVYSEGDVWCEEFFTNEYTNNDGRVDLDIMARDMDICLIQLIYDMFGRWTRIGNYYVCRYTTVDDNIFENNDKKGCFHKMTPLLIHHMIHDEEICIGLGAGFNLCSGKDSVVLEFPQPVKINGQVRKQYVFSMDDYASQSDYITKMYCLAEDMNIFLKKVLSSMFLEVSDCSEVLIFEGQTKEDIDCDFLIEANTNVIDEKNFEEKRKDLLRNF